MTETQPGQLLERVDVGGVAVMRVKVPMLRSDETTDALFEQAYALVEEAGLPRLAMDFAGVEYLASPALGKLVMLVRKVRAAGGRLALCRLSRTVESLLQVSYL